MEIEENAENLNSMNSKVRIRKEDVRIINNE
jgi:hypothetical protein